jgi:hypothetical protein
MANSCKPGITCLTHGSEPSGGGTLNGQGFHRPNSVGSPTHKRRSRHQIVRVIGMSRKAGDQAIAEALKKAIQILQQRQADLEKWDQATQNNFKAWFGTTDGKARAEIQYRVKRAIKKLTGFSVANFRAEPVIDKNDYAYVNPVKNHPEQENRVYLGPQFATANATTRAGTLIHEVSHFWSVQETEDVESCKVFRQIDPTTKIAKTEDCRVYEYQPALILARNDSRMALMNADNFEFFVENHDPGNLNKPTRP